ncbi:MAG: hypothetical protein K2X35_08060 [Bryobacteraceae bacterium]|nr:hypothetical protein [Bryobacteraceae bacterium]
MKTLGLLLSLSLTALAADPFLGTWKLNTGKSSWNPGPGPQSLILKWEAAGPATVRITGDGVTAAGKSNHYTYTAIYDGKEYPPKGSWNWDKVTNNQVDEYTREDVYFKDGREIGRERRTVSKDGKTLTYVSKFGPESNTMVFDRQP